MAELASGRVERSWMRLDWYVLLVVKFESESGQNVLTVAAAAKWDME